MLRWLALLAAAGAAAIVPVCLAAAAVQAAVISLEGFGRALRASHQGDYATERGIEAASSWEYAVDTAEEVAWETAPVPALGPGDTLALVFSCGLSRGHGEHTLAVDGVPRVVFATGAHRADTTWTGDQATLRFEPLLEDASGDVHGVMCLSLPGSLARAGQPLVLRVQGNPGGKGGWFMLHHFPDAGQYVRDGIVRLPSGRRLLLGPPRSLFAGQEWIEWSCPPALGGAAGAAPVDRLRLVATLAPVAAPPPGAPSVRAWTAEVAVGPAPARTRIRLWPTAQVGAGNHWLSLELQDAAGARCGRWQGQVAIRELTEFARLLAQAQAALAAVPVPPQGAAALADIAHASLSQALQRLPARPAQWATAAQLEAELPQLEQETRAVLAAVDRLRRGEDPYAGRTGFMLKAYRSALDGRLQPYGLFVPASPAPAAGYPLVVMLHGYTSTPTLAMRRVFGIAAAQDAPFTDHGFVVATPYNRDNIGYGNPLGEDDVWRVVEDVRRACPIDADRVYLTGLSMGGHGTVHLGLRHADRFAAIASVCGASDWRVWADRPVAELRARVLDSTNELPLADNALHLPVKLCHGDADATVNVEHSRRLAARLRELGYAVEYEEYPGVGHNAWDRAYADGRIFAWFRPFVRPRYPERVVLVTAEPARYGRSYWVRVTSLVRPYVLARIEARHDGAGMYTVRTENVGSFSLTLPAETQEGWRPVVVQIDGAVIRVEAPPAPGQPDPQEPAELLAAAATAATGGAPPPTAGRELHFARGVNGFALAPAAPAVYPVPCGGLEQLGSSWTVFVYGTGGSSEAAGANRRLAEQLAEVHGPVDIAYPVRADTAVTPAELASADLVLVGTPWDNAVLARLAPALPARIRPGAVTLGDSTYTGDDLLLVMARPHPTAPQRRAKIFVPLSAAAAAGLQHLDWGVPDYVLVRAGQGVVAEGLFDAAWQLAEPPPAE